MVTPAVVVGNGASSRRDVLNSRSIDSIVACHVVVALSR